MATYLAGPETDSCFKSVKHTGTPVGKSIDIAGVPTYYSEPPQSTTAEDSGKRVLLYFSDVFGPFYLNNQLLQDYFASCGFHVLGIDYFFGDPIGDRMGDPNWDRASWSEKSQKQAKESVPKWVPAVKEKFGSDAKYTAVGYCFGAPPTLEQAASGGVVAAAVAHPSRLTEEHFENSKVPLLLSCAETDGAFPVEARRKAEDILVKNKSKYFIQVFSGVAHGFAVKGDPNVPDVRWAKEESARGIIGWFDRFARES